MQQVVMLVVVMVVIVMVLFGDGGDAAADAWVCLVQHKSPAK